MTCSDAAGGPAGWRREVEVDAHAAAVARDDDRGRGDGVLALGLPGGGEGAVGVRPGGVGRRALRARLVDAADLARACRPTRRATRSTPAASSVDDLERRARRVALAVGEVVPGLGLVEAGLEVGGVRAAGDVDHRPVGVAGDLDRPAPRRASRPGGAGRRRRGRARRRAMRSWTISQSPSCRPMPSAQVVVVVEVEEPVLQPQVARRPRRRGRTCGCAARGGRRAARRTARDSSSWGRRCGRRRAPPCRRRSASPARWSRVSVGPLASRSPEAVRDRRRGAARCPDCRSIPRRCRRSTAPSSRTSGRAGGGAGDRRAHPWPYRTHRRRATASPLLWLIVRV